MKTVAPGLLVAAALVSVNCLAGVPSPEDDSTKRIVRSSAQQDVPCTPRRRLGFHEPLFGIYQFTKDDESSARLHYSFRYTVTDPGCEAPSRASSAAARADYERMRRHGRHEWYLSYTGQFDFYMGTRDSGPVINRISNPALHYRSYLGKRSGLPQPMQWWDVSIEHRSTGQTTDPNLRTSSGEYSTQTAHERGDHAYLDTMSQDTNFVSLEARWDLGPVRLWSRWKPVYFATTTAVTWGPMAGSNVSIADYDRFRFILGYRLADAPRLIDEKWLYGEWTVGDKGLLTDSFNISAYLPFKLGQLNIPFFARYHHGPLHTLSDFAKEQRSLGFGLLLLQ